MNTSLASEEKSSPVKSALFKQGSLVVGIFLLCVWKHEFILRVAHTEIYIFGLLMGVGLFGIYSTIRSTAALSHDYFALRHLQEMFDDIELKQVGTRAFERVRADRLKLSQIVFSRPTSLGASYSLLRDEIIKHGQLEIPTSTMQVLLADAQDKFEEKLGLNAYLGAIMVLLGLLGTFIGLMHTLESVGDILSNMNMSDADQDAIGRLIESLKGPLSGMAVGFGASLFGLVGSLVIGVLGRFQKRAADRIFHDFESWLLSSVQIEASRNSGEIATVSKSEVAVSKALVRIARTNVTVVSGLGQSIADLGLKVERIAQVIETGLSESSANVSKVALTVWRNSNSIRNLTDTLHELHTELSLLNSTVKNTEQSLASSIKSGTESVAAAYRSSFPELRALSRHLSEIAINASVHEGAMSSGPEITAAVDAREQRKTASSFEQDLAEMNSEVERLLRKFDALSEREVVSRVMEAG